MKTEIMMSGVMLSSVPDRKSENGSVLLIETYDSGRRKVWRAVQADQVKRHVAEWAAVRGVAWDESD